MPLCKSYCSAVLLSALVCAHCSCHAMNFCIKLLFFSSEDKLTWFVCIPVPFMDFFFLVHFDFLSNECGTGSDNLTLVPSLVPVGMFSVVVW